MKLSNEVELFSIGAIPSIGNYSTGGVIGLTDKGAAICRSLAEGDISEADALSSDPQLINHLKQGQYLRGSANRPSTIYHYKRAYLHVTERCNLSCRYCYSDSAQHSSLSDPSLPDIFSALNVLGQLKVSRLIISGGEPFLRDDLAVICRQAKQRNIACVEIITNGTVPLARQLSSMKDEVDTIYVSFDGCSENDRAWLRGQQRFETLISALKQIEELNVRPGIIATIHGCNFDSIDHYRRLAESFNATLRLSLLVMRDRCDRSFCLSEDQLVWLGKAEAAQNNRAQLQCRRSCGAGVTTLSVGANGNVYPCHMLHHKDYVFGNAYRDSVQTIVTSKPAALFRAINTKQFPSCRNCEHSYLCGGGCRARALYANNSLISKDPYCPLFKAYYSDITHRLERRYLNRR